MSIEEVLARRGPRRLLSMDGGGIRAGLTLEILARIEVLLREETGNPTFVLADYFDYIGGTSAGAIIGTLLALGKPVDEVRSIYLECSREMFLPAGLMQRLHHKFTAKNLIERLMREIGPEIKLGDPALRTLLMMVLRNATTDSPWPISNNPLARYNDRSQPTCNLEFPLWQLVRASTAAPTFFPPEVIEVKGRRFVFVDGAISTYNNPAFLLFLMATAAPYRLCWSTGEDQLLLVSIGTGNSAAANANLRPNEMNLLYHVSSIPSALISAAQSQQDYLCRILGRCLTGGPIDKEVDDLLDGANVDGMSSTRVPVFCGPDGPVPKLFSYVRYEADLSREGLDQLGLTDISAERIQRLDGVENIADLQRIGKAVADRDVRADIFARFLPENSTP